MSEAGLSIQKASMRDIPHILSIINSYAADGVMLPRTEFEMSENIRDFSIAYQADSLVGCGALHFYTPTSAEVRSLAVRPTIKQRGVGRALVEALEAEARLNDLHAIFAFTYAPEFFAKVGFSEIERGELPLKAWKDCLRCPKFQDCDEIAVLKRLGPAISATPVNSKDFTELIQLPQVRKLTFSEKPFLKPEKIFEKSSPLSFFK